MRHAEGTIKESLQDKTRIVPLSSLINILCALCYAKPCLFDKKMSSKLFVQYLEQTQSFIHGPTEPYLFKDFCSALLLDLICVLSFAFIVARLDLQQSLALRHQNAIFFLVNCTCVIPGVDQPKRDVVGIKTISLDDKLTKVFISCSR